MRMKLAVSVGCMFAFSSLVLGQGGHMGHNLEQNLVFPHFVLGSGFTTQLVLLNPQPGSAVTGTLLFFNQNGTPLQVSSNNQSVSQIPITIPAGGTTFVNVTGTTQDLLVGWALLEVPRGTGTEDPRTRVAGSVIFTNTQGNATVGSVGVVAANYLPGRNKRVAIPVTMRGTAINTGVAAVNAGSAAMTLNFELRNAQGAVVQSAATITPPISPLAPGNQVAKFVTEIFPNFGFNGNDFQGLLVMSTEQEGLEAVGLLVTNSLLTSVPAVRFGSAGGGGAQTTEVTNAGFTFSPADATITAGDSVKWTLASIHNVVEVTEATWNANGSTPKAQGFSTPFGGGTVAFPTAGTYFYVCSPHSGSGMKGRVIVNPAP